MAEFKVIEIIDYNIIETKPSWVWKNRDGLELKGNKIKISGIAKGVYAETLLKSLVFDKYVTLVNPKEIEGEIGMIECSVYLDGVDISKYF